MSLNCMMLKRNLNLYAGVGLCAALSMGTLSQAGEVDANLAANLRMVAPGTLKVVVQLEGEKPISSYAVALQALPRNARPGKLKSLMLADYQPVQQKVAAKLASIGARETHALWLMHSMQVEVQRTKLDALAALPGVKRVMADVGMRSAQRAGVNLLPLAKERAMAEAAAAAAANTGAPPSSAASTPQGTAASASAVSAPNKKSPNAKPYHSAVDALANGEPMALPQHFLALDVPAAWQTGARGKGVTVAIVDSGVDPRTAGVALGFRGRVGDWFDPYEERNSPTDFEGHGTYVAGLLVGDVVGASVASPQSMPTGVAPESKWIAARIFDDGGKGSLSAIQRIYQWLLDPDGKPETPDAPDIVNNSWGLPATVGRCDLSMARAIEALRAADIHVVFAAGNDGPGENTSLSPANNPGVISVGALVSKGEVSRRSSRGPSSCEATRNVPYPTVWTAGERLPALERMGLSAGVLASADGSSFAAASISGALAILRSAMPEASSQAVEEALMKSIPKGEVAGNIPQSPQLTQALAQLTGKPGVASAKAVNLQWQPTLVAGESLKLNAASLAKVTPWADPVTALSGEGVQAINNTGNEWEVKPVAGKPVMLSAKTAAGRDYTIALAPVFEGASPTAMARQEPVRTPMNVPVGITLKNAPAQFAQLKQGLRLSNPVRGGRLKLLESGQVQYTPPKDFVGTDNFTYQATQADGKPGATTVVTVQVQRP
jgi:Subtilase family/Bacterial Ig domain